MTKLSKYTRNYALAHINVKKLKKAAKKALIASNKHYSTWNEKQQEKYHHTKKYKAISKIEQVLLYELFGIKCKRKQAWKASDILPADSENILDWARLLTNGIGDDYIAFRLTTQHNDNLLDFPTLYDFNYEENLANEVNFSEQIFFWVQLIIQNQYYYATCISLADYIHDELDNFAYNYIDKLIPPAKLNHLSKNARLKINKKKGVVQNSTTNYLNNYLSKLHKRYSNIDSAVFVKHEDWTPCNEFNAVRPHLFFIFANENTIKHIRWKHFVSDVEPLIADYSFVNNELKKEKKSLKSYINESCIEVMKDTVPKPLKSNKT